MQIGCAIFWKTKKMTKIVPWIFVSCSRRAGNFIFKFLKSSKYSSHLVWIVLNVASRNMHYTNGNVGEVKAHEHFCTCAQWARWDARCIFLLLMQLCFFPLLQTQNIIASSESEKSDKFTPNGTRLHHQFGDAMRNCMWREMQASCNIIIHAHFDYAKCTWCQSYLNS